MKRSRARGGGEAMNLDPFLDVMTNVVGILVLIAIIVAVQSRNLEVTLGTPVLHDPLPGATRHLVHCSDNRVTFLDLTEVRSQAWAALETAAAERQGRPFQSERELEAMFERLDVGNGTHRVVYADEHTCEAVMRPDVGEPSAVLPLEESLFNQRIRALDPQRHWFFFLVDESSFGTFRIAREVARSHGFDVGWYPHADGEAVSFTPNGKIGSKAQ